MRFIKLYVLIFFNLLISISLADTSIIIAGNANDDNYYQFRNMIDSAYRSFSQNNDKIFVGSNLPDDRIDFLPKGLNHSSTESEKDLERILKQAVEKSDPNEPIKIYFTGHGYNPRRESSTQSGGVKIGFNNVSHKAIKKMIKKIIGTKRPVKIIASHCYGGGINSIAHDLPNVCSASATDYRSFSRAEALGQTTYGSKFFNSLNTIRSDLNKDGKVSMWEAHFLGSRHDYVNDWRGEISSFSYVNKILEKGPYKSRLNWFQELYSSTPETSNWNFKDLTCDLLSKKISLSNEDDILKLANYINNIDIQKHLDNINDYNLPDDLKGIFSLIIKDWDKHKKLYLGAFLDQRNIFNKQLKEMKKADNPFYKAYFHENMMEAETYANRYMSRYLGLFKTLDEIKKMNEFYKIASKKEIKKFEQLLKCETDSFHSK